HNNQFCVNIDWSTANVNRTVDSSAFISFEKSGLSLVKRVSVEKDDIVSFSMWSYCLSSEYSSVKIYDSSYILKATLYSNNNMETSFKPFEIDVFFIFIYGPGRITSDLVEHDNYLLLNIRKASEAELIYNNKEVISLSGDFYGSTYLIKVDVPYNTSKLVSLNIESLHPYSDSTIKTWKIEHSEAEWLAIHFDRISLQSSDYLYIYDKYNKTLQSFTSTQKNDLWVGFFQTDTIYIKISTSTSGHDWGFKIDKIYYLQDLSEKPKTHLSFTRSKGSRGYCFVYSSDLSKYTYLLDSSHDNFNRDLDFPTSYTLIIFLYANSGIRLNQRNKDSIDFYTTIPNQISYQSKHNGDSKLFAFQINESCSYLALTWNIPVYSNVYLLNPNLDRVKSFLYSGSYSDFIDSPMLGTWYVLTFVYGGCTVKFTLLTRDGENTMINDTNVFYNCFIGESSTYYAMQLNTKNSYFLYSSFGGYGTSEFSYRYIGDSDFCILTNGSWKASTTLETDWILPDYNDSFWNFADSPHLGNTNKPYWQDGILYNSDSSWIWADTSDTTSGSNYFRRTFQLTEIPQECILYFTAPNKFFIYINGIYLGYTNGYNIRIQDIASYLRLGKNVIAISVYAASGFDGLFGEIIGYPFPTTIFQRTLTSSKYYYPFTTKTAMKDGKFLVYISGNENSNVTFQLYNENDATIINNQSSGFVYIEHYGDSYLIELENNYKWSMWFSALQNNYDARFIQNNATSILKQELKTNLGDYFSDEIKVQERIWLFISGQQYANISFNLITNNSILPKVLDKQELNFNYDEEIFYFYLQADELKAFFEINLVSSGSYAHLELFFSNITINCYNYASYMNPIFYYTENTEESYIIRIRANSGIRVNLTFNLSPIDVELPYLISEAFNNQLNYKHYTFNVSLTDYLCFNFTNLNSYNTKTYIFNPSRLSYTVIGLGNAGQQYNFQIEFPSTGEWQVFIVGEATAQVNINIYKAIKQTLELPIRVSFINPINYAFLKDYVEIIVSASCKFGCPNSSLSGFLQVQINDTGYNEWYTFKYNTVEELFSVDVNFTKYPDGYATITAVFQDEEGHIGANSIFIIIDNDPGTINEWNLYIDDDGPSITPIAPATNNTIVHGVYTLKFAIYDYTNVSYTAISLDNRSTWFNLNFNPISGYYEYVWDTTAVQASVIWVNCSDFWGNYNNASIIVNYEASSPYSMLIYVDNSAPKIEMISPRDGFAINNTYLLEFKITDLSDISVANISVDNGTSFFDLTFNETTGLYEFLWDTELITTDYVFIGVADNLDNSFIYSIPVSYDISKNNSLYEIIIDCSAPEISILNNVLGEISNLTLEITDQSSIHSVQIGLENGTIWDKMIIEKSNSYDSYWMVSYLIDFSDKKTTYLLVLTEDIWHNSFCYRINISYLGNSQTEEEFVIQIDPKPIIVSKVIDTIDTEWDDSPYLLNWQIFDNDPLKWYIYYSDTYTETINNQTLIKSEVDWDVKREIVFDLNSLDYKKGFLILLIKDKVNQTDLQMISYRLIPAEAPIIVEAPERTYLISEDTLQKKIVWKCFDYSEMSYQILFNGIIFEEQEHLYNYKEISLYISFDLFLTYELDNYLNITLKVKDTFGLETIDTCFFILYQEKGEKQMLPQTTVVIVSLIPTIGVGTYASIKYRKQLKQILSKLKKI
ncbi:MAG: hypothetical protein ACTSR2_04980, partial [Candidatus Hodarchaeales archaeon]